MTKRIILFISIILFTNNVVLAQNGSKWGVAIRHQYAIPIGSLGNWFKPTPASLSLSLGKFTNEGWFWEIQTEMMQYSRENAAKLFYDDLNLKLDIYGIGAQAKYNLLRKQARLQPSVTGGAAIYRWFGYRGEYQLDDRTVPERNQNDWSWGFNIGLGLDIFIYKNWAVTLSGSYQLIIGELWPALALRLENVSGFQSWKAASGISFYF